MQRQALSILVCVGLSGCGGSGGSGEDRPDARTSSLERCRIEAATGPLFYVAENGDDDAGDGSEQRPWATITNALDNVPDGATVLVEPGTYPGRTRLRGQFASGVLVRSRIPYRAKLRHDSGAAVTSYEGKGITLEGFDIAHSGGGGGLVVQIQDLIGESGGDDFVTRIVLRNNILHDSYNNDILKINNGAGGITVECNMFYNQEGSDEHIDINSVGDVVVQDNVFFNDFAGSGRNNNNDTSSYVVVKDSNGSSDSYTGSTNIRIRRNVFANWEGSSGNPFLLVGEDGTPTFEADGVVIENNLFLGNSSNQMRASFGVKGSRDVQFRSNTVVGNLPSNAYAFRLNTEADNQPNEQIVFVNNVWSDATGTMDDFSDTPVGETASFTLDNNVYWNGGEPIPSNESDAINIEDDENAIVGDPGLADPSGLVPPSWDERAGEFRGGFATIAAVFESLVQTYGVPGAGSVVIDAARADLAPDHDILGNLRTSPDVGAVERQ